MAFITFIRITSVLDSQIFNATWLIHCMRVVRVRMEWKNILSTIDQKFRVLKIVSIRNSIEVTVRILRTPLVRFPIFFLKVIDFLVWVTDYYKISNRDIFCVFIFFFSNQFWKFGNSIVLIFLIEPCTENKKLPHIIFWNHSIGWLREDLRSTFWVHLLPFIEKLRILASYNNLRIGHN